MWQAIVFDGDDTLWETEALYDDARQRAREIVETAGLDGARWEEFERRIDVQNVARLGHSVARFPLSCVEAYESLCEDAGRPVDRAVGGAVRDAARTVFERPAALLPHARETLLALGTLGVQLALLTKGDRALQYRRIEQSGLAEFFDLIEVVDHKEPETIAALIERLGVEAPAALSVGNSVRSDVMPSLAAGVQPVWIDAHVWEYERDHEPLGDGVIALADLGGLLDIVGP